MAVVEYETFGKAIDSLYGVISELWRIHDVHEL
jgi:hypothetical protein